MNTAPPAGWSTDAEVIAVPDGDTIKVKISRIATIRMEGCWTPESKTKNAKEKQLGLAAKRFLEDLFAEFGNKVRVFMQAAPDLQLSRSFSFGRVIGRVWLPDGRDVAAIMESAGHATKTKEEQEERMRKAGVKGRYVNKPKALRERKH